VTIAGRSDECGQILSEHRAVQGRHRKVIGSRRELDPKNSARVGHDCNQWFSFRARYVDASALNTQRRGRPASPCYRGERPFRDAPRKDTRGLVIASGDNLTRASAQQQRDQQHLRKDAQFHRSSHTTASMWPHNAFTKMAVRSPRPLLSRLAYGVMLFSKVDSRSYASNSPFHQFRRE
jgi:hypothetical protein